ncbi:hypothetical protein [Polaromonas sp. YR568]|uniref:hypothetical protein n=1 Tax=Polaromonas sp. YR568 TaxID=1855301 RepID=UPI003137D749
MFKKIMVFALAAVAAVSSAFSGASVRVAAVVGAGSLALTAATPALAVPPDMSGLTNEVDFSTAIAALLLVAGSLMVVYIVVKASQLVLGMVKRG